VGFFCHCSQGDSDAVRDTPPNKFIGPQTEGSKLGLAKVGFRFYASWVLKKPEIWKSPKISLFKVFFNFHNFPQKTKLQV